MSYKVKSINVHEVKEMIKDCPKEVRAYVKSLENALDRQSALMNKAIRKLRNGE